MKKRTCVSARPERVALFRLGHGGRGLLAASLTLAMIGAAGTPRSAQAQLFTWTGAGAASNWNDPGNWGGVLPTSSNTTSLLFAGSLRTSNIHNLGAFTLNSLGFAPGASAFTITTSASAGSLIFAGTTPRITQNSANSATIGSAVTTTTTVIPITLNSLLTIDGSGFGNLTINGPISGNNGITINQTGTLFGARGSVVALSGSTTVPNPNANTFTGDVTLNNGNLSLGMPSALGNTANNLIVNNGDNSVRFLNNVTIANNAVLNADMNIAGATTGTWAGVISGTGGLNLISTSSPVFALTAANTFSGDINIGTVSQLLSLTATGPTLRLEGNGTISTAQPITVNNGSTLSIINAAATNLTNRIPDATPIFLNNGRITYEGAAGAASNETFGNLTVTGQGVITPNSQTGAASTNTMNFGTLTRMDNATLFVRNSANTERIGGAPGAEVTNIFFSGGLPTISDPNGPVGGQNVGIVPFVGGTPVGGATFTQALFTYDANGLRLLASGDTNSFNVITTANQNLAANRNNSLANVNASVAPISGTLRINSFVIGSPGPTTTTLSGTGANPTLQIHSGAVANFFDLLFSNLTVDFASNTGYFHMGDAVNFNAGSQITGSGGVVFSTLTTSGIATFNNTANPFTGGLFINGIAEVRFTDDAQLGAAGGAITINGGELAYNGTTSATLGAARPLKVGAGSGAVSSVNAAGTLTIPQAINGTGTLFKTGAGVVELQGANTYTGDTVIDAGTLRLTGSNTGGGATIIDAGTLQINSVNNLASGALVNNGGTLEFLATGTYNKPLQITANSTLSAASPVVATLSAPITSGVFTLTKAGTGEVVLTADNNHYGAVTVSAGLLTLAGANGTLNRHTGTTTVANGARLTLDNSAGVANRLPDTSPVSLTGGELRLIGRDNTATTETIGTLSATGTTGAVRLIPGANASLILNLANYTLPTAGNSLTFFGLNLGEDTGGVGQFTRVFIGSLTVETVLANTFVDTGSGIRSAIYDPILGIRGAVIFNANASTPIQNSAPVNTPTNADVFATGAVVTNLANEDNTIASLRLEDNTTVTIKPNTTLTLTSGKLTFAAGSNQAVNGGTLNVGNATFLLDALNTGAATIGSALSGTNGLVKNGTGQVNITGSYGITGTLTTNAGTLQFANDNTNTITSLTGLAAGTINLATANTILVHSSTTTQTINPILSGPGSFVQAGTGTLTFAGNNPLTGALRITGTGEISLTAAIAAFPSVSSVFIGNGGVLNLNSATAANNNTNRINNAAAIGLHSGEIDFTGGGGVVSSETFGNVTSTGYSILTTDASATANSTAALNFGTLTRNDNGAFFIRTSATTETIGGAPGVSVTNISFTGGLPIIADPSGPVGGQNIGVIPFITGDFSSTGTDPEVVATYDANGIRFLDPASTTNFNVITTANQNFVSNVNNSITNAAATINAISGTTRINSLVKTTTNALTLSGTGANPTLQVFSGLIATSGILNINDLALDFGANTGYFHMGSDINFNAGSTLLGTNGVVFNSLSTADEAIFNNASNSFTGGLFINGLAEVVFTADAQLGAAGQPIILGGGTLSFNQASSFDFAAARTIRVNESGGGLGVNNASGTMTVANTISGPGSLTKSGTGTLILSGNNTYTGDTIVSAGTLRLTGSNTGGGGTIINGGALQFNTEANLASGLLTLSGGDLQPLQSGTVARNIFVDAASDILITTGLNVTFSGVVSGTAGITKTGEGTVVFTGVNTKASTLAVGTTTAPGGVLALSGAGSFRNVTTVTVQNGGQFLLDNTGGAADRLGTATGVTLSGGEFRINGANTATSESFGVLNRDADGGIVTLARGAGVSLIVTASNLTGTGPILFRGTNLGTAGGAQLFITGLTQNNIIPNALYDGTLTGLGSALAFYDTTLGVRALLDSDYLQTGKIQNDDNPGPNAFNTPKNANVLVGGTFAAVDTEGPNGNTIGSLRFQNNGVLTLDNATPTLTLGSGVLRADVGANGVINQGTLNTSTGTFDFLTEGDLTVNSILGGTAGLNKSGAGTLALNGNNNFNGTVTVNAGTLSVGSATGIPGGTGNDITLALNTILNLGNFVITLDDILGSGTVNVAAGGQVTVTNDADMAVLNLGNNALFSAGGGTTITNAATLGAGSTLRIRAASTLDGTISGAGGIDVTTGTLTLNGNNTFTGGVTGGTGARYAFGHPNAFSNAALNLTNNTAATIIGFNFGSGTVANNIGLSTATGGDPYASTLDNNSAGTSVITLSGVLSGGNIDQTLLQFEGPTADTSTFVLTNPNNSFTVNEVRVLNGLLGFTSNEALGAATNVLHLFAGAGIQFGANNINMTHPIFLRGTALGAASSVIDTQGFNGTLSGGLFNDNVSIPVPPNPENASWIKRGSGVLTIANSPFGNTFTGRTLVNEGTLRLATNYSTSPITVNTGGTLDGTGTAGALTLNGGQIGAGNGTGATGVGVLSASSLLWETGVFVFDLSNPSSSAASDRLDLTTFFNKGASAGLFAFSFTDTGNAQAGATYTLVRFQGGSTNFTSADFTAQNATGVFVLDAAGGNLSFTLTGFGAVPEPSTVGLLLPGVGTAALIVVRRRRRKN